MSVESSSPSKALFHLVTTSNQMLNAHPQLLFMDAHKSAYTILPHPIMQSARFSA